MCTRRHALTCCEAPLPISGVAERHLHAAGDPLEDAPDAVRELAGGELDVAIPNRGLVDPHRVTLLWVLRMCDDDPSLGTAPVGIPQSEPGDFDGVTLETDARSVNPASRPAWVHHPAKTERYFRHPQPGDLNASHAWSTARE